jgi:retron-type reverse transcriptase
MLRSAQVLIQRTGKVSPLGLSIFEDKVVPRAVRIILSSIYEQGFFEVSFELRKGHSPHAAIREWHKRLAGLKATWVSDANISGSLASINHWMLIDLLRQRRHGDTLVRLVGKWRKAGSQLPSSTRESRRYSNPRA